MLAAIAVVLSAAESAIPVPVPAPGIKLGLANAVTLFMLLNEGNPAYAAGVTLARCVLSALITANFSALLFSLSGGLVSCVLMWMLLQFNFSLSAYGVSVAGAISHNMAQLATASLIARDPAIMGYAPVLLIVGAVAGFAIGYLAIQIDRIINSRIMHK